MALEALSSVSKNLTLEEAEKIDIDKLENFFMLPDRRKNYYESAICVLKKALNEFKK